MDFNLSTVLVAGFETFGPDQTTTQCFIKRFSICFYVSEAKPLCFSLCSQMFDDAERC